MLAPLILTSKPYCIFCPEPESCAGTLSTVIALPDHSAKFHSELPHCEPVATLSPDTAVAFCLNSLLT